MTPLERDIAWPELCGWVTWLYDRYELSVESRLPDCWADHPGLIEELWALMAWRKEIYTSDQPSGQAARYWHTELRTVITSSTTYYAANCRTGHQAAPQRAADAPELQKRWAKADPWAGIPTAVLAAQAAETPAQPGTMPGLAMQEAIADGLAHPLSSAIPEYVRFSSSWWLDDGAGAWVRVVDQVFTDKLDASAASLAEATAATQRRRAARALFASEIPDHAHGSRNTE